MALCGAIASGRDEGAGSVSVVAHPGRLDCDHCSPVAMVTAKSSTNRTSTTSTTSAMASAICCDDRASARVKRVDQTMQEKQKKKLLNLALLATKLA